VNEGVGYDDEEGSADKGVNQRGGEDGVCTIRPDGSFWRREAVGQNGGRRVGRRGMYVLLCASLHVAAVWSMVGTMMITAVLLLSIPSMRGAC
jgi:hypothetical protein